MKGVVLAAGFATRLYPLTKDFPKPLLEVGGESVIDRLLGQLRRAGLEELCVVCNARFAGHFETWRPRDVELVVNEAADEQQRLGAVGDLALALSAIGTGADVLVAAADNIFELDFSLFRQQFARSGRSCIGLWHNPDPEDRRRRGNAAVDAEGRVTDFVEKPATAQWPYSSAPIYAYRPQELAMVSAYLAGGGNADAPGHFVQWLVRQTPLSAFILPQPPVDIGNLAALRVARERYGE